MLPEPRSTIEAQGVLAAEEHAADVHVHDAVIPLLVLLEDGPQVPDPGVVAEDVYALEAGEHIVHQTGDLIALGDVGRDALGAPPASRMPATTRSPASSRASAITT